MTRLAVSAVATSICSVENAFFSLIALVDQAIFFICRSGCRRALAVCRYPMACDWLAVLMCSILTPFTLTEYVRVLIAAESAIFRVHSDFSCSLFDF